VCFAKVPEGRRTKTLETEGYRLLRFWNHEVLKNIDAVMNAIQPVQRGHPSRPAGVPAGRLLFEDEGLAQDTITDLPRHVLYMAYPTPHRIESHRSLNGCGPNLSIGPDRSCQK
jgi:hypothetical protein